MFTIKTPTTHDDFKSYYALRYRVLREPWGHPRGTEKDDYEPISEHFMAVNEKGEVVGVVKLYQKDECTGHISHLAVAPEYQHKGIGHLLLESVERRARECGFGTLATMAQCDSHGVFREIWLSCDRCPDSSSGNDAPGPAGKAPGLSHGSLQNHLLPSLDTLLIWSKLTLDGE